VPYEFAWWEGTSVAFPHVINGNDTKIGPDFYYQFMATPYSNEFLGKFASTVLDQEKLGQDKYPNMLAVSFSATDIAGHMFGPYSQELEDIVVRLDDVLASLLDSIDRRVGLDNTLIALTADHGVAPIPGYSQAHGLGGARIMGSDLKEHIETTLRA